ncbi:MAG: HEAT repeat domain-containing protein [Acidobacteriota bacterium]
MISAMVPLFIFALVFLIAGRSRQSNWQSTADRLGLKLSAPLVGRQVMRGHRNGYYVEIASQTSDDQNTYPVAEVHGVHPGFSLSREGTFQRLLAPDIEIGDSRFDKRIRVEGDPLFARALLGGRARRSIRQLIDQDPPGSLKGGVLQVAFDSIEEAPVKLSKMIHLVELLTPPEKHDDLAQLLAKRTQRDDSPSVRRQAFEQLIAIPSWSAVALEAAEKGLGSPSLRLESARFLLSSRSESSERAAQVLLATASQRHLDPAARCSALDAVLASRFAGLALPKLIEILHEQHEEPASLRRSALGGLLKAGTREELLRLSLRDPRELETLAQGLERLGSSAERRLVELLAHPEDRVRVAAAGSLQKVGTLEAVASLRKVAGEDSIFRSKAARAAAEAIEAIKQRSGKAARRGAVSIAEISPLEGAVSEADEIDEARGKVSLSQ